MMGLPLPSLLLLAFCCSPSQGSSSPLRLGGDYMLAGLFPIHRSTAVKRHRSKPEVDSCESLDQRRLHSYHLVQAMRFAVEEINHSSHLLPNISLGYEIHDSCLPSATMYATLSILSQGGDGCHSHQRVAVAANYTLYLPKAVAAIGPDSSEDALLVASLLGVFRMPEVSYEASSPTLSLKRVYPSFLRTIPSDHVQVHALVRLLKKFNWIWVAVVGSDNNYGHQGLQMLHDTAARAGICFAYQGVVPVDQEAGSAELEAVVRGVVASRVNVTIVFANKHSAAPFFQEVVRQNVTGRVWVGTEDWTLAAGAWQIPGIRDIGTVMGMAVKQTYLPEMAAFDAASSPGCGRATGCGKRAEACSQRCSQFCRPGSPGGRLEPSPYDMQGAFSVYSAVYAVAHGLHRLLRCQRGACHKDVVYPWQLLTEMKRVNFSLRNRWIDFDPCGDASTGYDVVTWQWAGQAWNYSVVGSFSRNPDRLSIDGGALQWHTQANQVPVSACSEDCGVGEQKVPQGIHRCCFHCVGCLPGTFLNRSDSYTCQRCGEDQWSPARSETCFARTSVFLAWDDHVSVALLTATTVLTLLVAGATAVFFRNLRTPIVKSAGGCLCFAMLGSLACASTSLYWHFGAPGNVACLVRAPLYNVSFTVCLACMLARSFQIVIIFKVAARAPGLYEAWRRYHGPGLLIGTLTGLQGLLSLLQVSTSPPAPYKNYEAFPDMTVLECSLGGLTGLSLGLAYDGFLGIACFAISYVGKDLPNSYNEAKCITFSLLIYFVSFIFFTTTQALYQGKYQAAIGIASRLSTLSGIFGSYFAPKVYVILFRSELNTHEQFQMSIQMYTKRISSAS